MSLTGLNDGDFTDINVMFGIGLGLNADKGDNGQVVKSDGSNATWGDDENTTYQGGTGITIDDTTDPDTIKVSGALTITQEGVSKGTYQGETGTIALTDSDTTYSAGDGLDLSGTTFSADLKSGSGLAITSTELDLKNIPNSALANNTISGIALGSNLASLSPSTNISMSASGYNGTGAVSISSTNTTYTAGDGLELDGTEFKTDLKSSSGLTITSGELDLASIPNSALTNSTISGVALGSNLSSLSPSTNISMTESVYNGTTAVSISATDTNTTYTAGDGLDLGGTTFSLDLKSSSGLAITSTELDLVDIPSSALADSFTPLVLPTSSSGLPSNAIYASGGRLYVVP